MTKKTAKKTAKKKATSTIRIRQIRSVIGRPWPQRRILEGLGLRRIRHEVEQPDNPAIRGMVNKISHLVEVVEE